jgi:hypothetical protein
LRVGGFEVVDMDGRRVDKVLAVPPRAAPEPARGARPTARRRAGVGRWVG